MPSMATPLLRSQENVWEYVHFFEPEDPGRAACNVFNTIELSEVDIDVFRAALADVIRRHDALRIVFDTVGNDPLVRIEDEIELPLRFVDLSGEPLSRRAARMASILGHESHRSFDLTKGPLWSVTVLRLASNRYVVAVCLFHVIADGSSTNVFLRDLKVAYRARAGGGPPLAPLPVGYAEALASPRWSGAERARRVEYWRRQLLPLPERFPFAVTPPHPGVDWQAEASLGTTLPAELVRRLTAFARTRQITPYMLFLGAYRILLGVVTGWDRVVLGSAVLGRDGPGSSELVGQFTHNLYVATTIPRTHTLHEALGEVRTSVFGGMRNMASFKEIAPAVNPDFERMRPWPYILLYHAWFITAPPGYAQGRPTGEAEDTGIREHRARGLRVTHPERVAEQADVWVKRGEPNMTVSADWRTVFIRYNPCFYQRDEMADLVLGYRRVLEELLRDPHQRVADLKPR
jgi:hypothetical protein